MNLGAHQVFEGGEDKTRRAATGGRFGTLTYYVRLGEGRSGSVGHGDDSSYQSAVPRLGSASGSSERRLPGYFFILVKVIRETDEMTGGHSMSSFLIFLANRFNSALLSVAHNRGLVRW